MLLLLMEIMKKSTQITLISILVLIVGLYFFYDIKFISNSRYSIRNETILSEKINPELDDLSIAYFSDLEYGEFVDKSRLEKIVNSINSTHADVVIFGGDIMAPNLTITESQKKDITELLTQIKAPLGKFAVLGDNDINNETNNNEINDLLLNSDFEVLHNTQRAIRNDSSASINIVGLDNKINGDTNYANAFENISNSTYTLVVSHTPDTALDIDQAKTDYFLSGHSHGGQINILFYSYYTPEYAETFTKGKKIANDTFTVDITNGVGTTGKDFRIGANAEIVLYKFKHLEVTEQTEESN